MKALNLIILVLLPIFFSCKNEQQEKEKHIAQLVNEWQGKEIKFPDNLIFTRYLTDTTNFQITQSEYKILVYVDSIGCTSCKLQLHKWKEFIKYTDSVTKGIVPFLFFFHPKDRIEIQYLLKSYEIDRPVCIDLEDRLNKLNHFSTNIEFQTFLLDKQNKVVVLGNPIHNTTVKDLYLKQLTGKDSSTKKMLRTTAKTTQTEIDFGTFEKTNIKETNIKIKNTGNNPLIIIDINTSCGCTTVKYDKTPVKPGDIIQVKIKMTPKDTGFFNEIVTIKCNTAQPIKVKLRGQAQ